MKRFIALVLATLLLALCACTGGKAEAPAGDAPEEAIPMNEVTYPVAPAEEDIEARIQHREDNAVTEAFLAAMETFSFRTAAQVLKNPAENANFSPISLYLALALCTNGAAGETQAEMLTLMGMPDAQALTDQCARLYRLLYKDSGAGRMQIYNSLWMDERVMGNPIKFRDAYLSSAAADYYASLFQADFATAAAGDAMGKWVADRTHGVLTPSFPTDPERAMAILNTVYFYDEWADAFLNEDTKPGAFHALSGDVTADFMNRVSSSGSFSRGENFTRSSLWLKNLGEMAFVLPDEGVDLSALMQDEDALRELFTGGTEDYGQVTWSVPKFRYGAKYDLAAALNALGVSAAFDADKADFTGMADAPLWLSKVEQQTHIAIDEKGVEAAAYTEIGLAASGISMGRADMILDRPFLYGILSRDGTPLFIGLCADPTAVS